MSSRTASSRPRSDPFKAKVAKICRRSILEFLRTPSHLYTREYITLNSRNCLITSCCKAYCPNAGLRQQARKLCRTYLLETKASGLGQVHAFTRPRTRPPKFALEVSSSLRPVLEDLILSVRISVTGRSKHETKFSSAEFFFGRSVVRELMENKKL